MKEQAIVHIVTAIANLTLPDLEDKSREIHLEILRDNLKKII